MPKIAMRTAPPAMRMVPMSIHGEKTSPRRRRAKKAFQRRATAPRGARMTTGRDAIWKREPRMLEEMKMVKPRSQRLRERVRVSMNRVEIEKEMIVTVSCVRGFYGVVEETG